VYDTTLALARFNNSGSQLTVVVIQNPTNQTVTGHMHFWGVASAPLASQAFTLSARAALVLNTSTLPTLQGQSGSVTVAHDAGYGALVGKTVALEPATGFSFDSPLEPRAR
jgi:hypothetical protein